ncbi:hypothetical protein [Aurantivibrio plasticivorans]
MSITDLISIEFALIAVTAHPIIWWAIIKRKIPSSFLAWLPLFIVLLTAFVNGVANSSPIFSLFVIGIHLVGTTLSLFISALRTAFKEPMREPHWDNPYARSYKQR